MLQRLRFSLLLTFATAVRVAAAGNDNPPIGARAAGLSGAVVTLADVWSVANNVGGLARLHTPEAGLYFENRFGIKAFNTVVLQAVYPLEGYGTAGLDLYRFGDQFYSEQRLGLGFGHQLGMVSLGLKADVLQVSISELGSRKAVALSFGGVAEVIPELFFGAHIYNFNQAKLAEFEDERIPTVMKAGLSYRPLPHLMLNVESEKNIDLPAEFKAGLEYLVMEKLALRTGIAAQTRSGSFGAGWRARRFQVDYALGTASRLGISNHVSVSCRF